MKSHHRAASFKDLVPGPEAAAARRGTGADWYRPDRRRAAAAEPDAFVHPVRVNRTKKRVIGWFQSLITKTAHPYHSSLELDWLRLIDLTPGVVGFQAQPRTFQYWMGGVRHEYTPDVALTVADGRQTMVEIKMEADAQDASNQARWPAIRARLAEERLGFRIVTERYLHREPRRKNVLYLQMFRSLQPDEAMAFQITEAVDAALALPLAVLAGRFPDSVLARQTVLSLVLRRHLEIDLNAEIGPRTLVRLATYRRQPVA